MNDYAKNGYLVASTLKIVSNPQNGSAEIKQNGQITYSPNTNFVGGDFYKYEIKDSYGQKAQATVNIKILPVNEPPIAVNDRDTTMQNQPVTTLVLINDKDNDGTLYLPSLKIISLPANGTLSLNNQNGTISYSPKNNFYGSDSYVYEICDNQGKCASATVTILVQRILLPPNARNDAGKTKQNTSVTVNVLQNDSDLDGIIVYSTLKIHSAPLNGSVEVNATSGEILYSPRKDFFGKDIFTYEICDDDGLCDSATATIDIEYVGKPPVARNDFDSTNINISVTTDILYNDFDEKGLNPASVRVVESALNGQTIVNLENGKITYVPNRSFTGYDSYVYEVCNLDSLCATATVLIHVINKNHPPQAETDFAQTTQGTPISVDVLTNDFDIDDDLVDTSLTIVKLPSSKVSAKVEEGKITIDYSERPNFVGRDTLLYRICDAVNNCDVDTVFITIRVNSDLGLIIPNGFSPNTDGINDKFEMPGIENFPDNEIFIYNRWGNEVFRKKNYKGDWDGRALQTQKPVPTGTYFFILYIKGKDPINGYLYVNP